MRGELTVLRGEYGGSLEAIAPEPAEPVVVFAGRLIREKRALLGLAGVAAARDQITGLRGEFYGDGPERGALLPSSREGYAVVVVEAAARGVPSIVVAAPDNAATELVEDGVNGFVVAEPTPEAIAAAIVRAHDAGPQLRASTSRWFAENAERLSVDASVPTVLEGYAGRVATPAG